MKNCIKRLLEKEETLFKSANICLDCNKIYEKDLRLKNLERRSKKQKQWADKNREKQRQSVRNSRAKLKVKNAEYDALRLKTDPAYRLKRILRTRLSSAINRGQKAGSAVRDLGCSVSELKTYLESKFLPGMAWDNHTQFGWHIDHIIPLSSFNLTNREELLKACHYTNLQPMWAQDNLSKSNKHLAPQNTSDET